MSFDIPDPPPGQQAARVQRTAHNTQRVLRVLGRYGTATQDACAEDSVSRTGTFTDVLGRVWRWSVCENRIEWSGPQSFRTRTALVDNLADYLLTWLGPEARAAMSARKVSP